MHRPDVWLQTTPVILDQRQRLASKGRPCMEDACSRMECGKDAICRGVRRSVRGQSLNQLGSAHKISDSPLGAFTANPLAVRFAYEWHDDSNHWYRSYGNENWEFNEWGFMLRRFASINDLPIADTERKFFWALGRRPDEHPSLSDLGL